MSQILNRYIFRQIMFSLFCTTLILTAALWLTQSLRFIDIVISHGFSMTIFLKMVIFLIPDLMSIILPISTLITILFIYNRLFSDSELIIMRSVGMSNFALTKPALKISLLITLIHFIINLYFLPLSFQQFKDLEHHLKNNVVSYLIQPGEFSTFKDITVYVQRRYKNGNLKGLLIHDSRDSKAPFTLIAEEGLILERPDGLSIVMINGNRQQIDMKTGKPNILEFDDYTVDLAFPALLPEGRKRKPYERFLGDLLNPNVEEESPKMIRKLYAEAHQRLIIPLTTLCFMGIALAFLLSGDYNRRGRSKKIMCIIGLCIFFEILVISLINLSERWPLMIVYAYIIMALSFLFSLKIICLSPKKNIQSTNQ